MTLKYLFELEAFAYEQRGKSSLSLFMIHWLILYEITAFVKPPHAQVRFTIYINTDASVH